MTVEVPPYSLGGTRGGLYPVIGRPCFQRKEQEFLDFPGINKFRRRCGVCYGWVFGDWRLGGHLCFLMGFHPLGFGGIGPTWSWALRGRVWECVCDLDYHFTNYNIFNVGAPSAWSHIQTP